MCRQLCNPVGTLALALALALAAAGPLQAQSDPRALVADQLIQRVQATLNAVSTPRDDQFARASVYFDMALKLSPDDPELWRLRHELARQTGDRERQLEALRRYCELAGYDDVAQLELIKSSHDGRQTLEERVEAVRGLLDSAGAESFSVALRSRLASYVAEGARELGDAERFVRYVAMAVRLDPTNRHGAQLAYEHVVGQPHAEAAHVTAALMQLIGADPLDAQPRLDLARLLLHEGLYMLAAEQFGIAHRFESQWLNDTVVFDWSLTLGAAGALNDALGVLSGATRTGSASSDEEGDQGEAEAAPAAAAAAPAADAADAADADAAAKAAEVPPAVERTLPLDLELLRLALLDYAGAEAGAEAAHTRIRARLGEGLAAGDSQAAVDMLWVAQLFNREGPPEQDLMEGLDTGRAGMKAMLERIRGWRALNREAYEEAAAILEPLAARDRFAAYGLALCRDADGGAQAEALRAVVTANRADLPGLLAALQLYRLRQWTDVAEGARDVAGMIDRWTSTLRAPSPAAYPMSRISLTVQPMRFGYLDPIHALIQVRNDSNVPLAIGPRGPIPSTVFLVISTVNQGLLVEHQPTVVDMRRRLRIPPGRSLIVRVRLDHSVLGARLTRTPADYVSMDVKALLDPEQKPGEPFGVTWLGATDAQRALIREANQPKPADLAQWIGDATGPDPGARLRALARLVQFGPRIGDVEELKPYADRMGQTLNEHFASFRDYEQMWICLFMGIDDKSKALFSTVHELAQRSTDPMVRIAYMGTVVTDPESPVINDALRDEDPVISQFAEAHRVGIIKTREAIIQARRQAIDSRRRRQ